MPAMSTTAPAISSTASVFVTYEQKLRVFAEHWKIKHAAIVQKDDDDYTIYGPWFRCACGMALDTLDDMVKHIMAIRGETIADHFMAKSIVDAIGRIKG